MLEFSNLETFEVVLDEKKLGSYLMGRKILKEDCFFFDGEDYILKGYYLDHINNAVAEDVADQNYIFSRVGSAEMYSHVGLCSVELSAPCTKSGHAEIVEIDCEVLGYA